MTRASWAWAAAAGVMLVAGVGCYSPAPYQPGYGYPSYQTMPGGAYPAAPGGAYPGGSYVVPGGAVPGTLGPSSTMPGTGPTLAPPMNGGDAPPATYAPGSTPPGNMVPPYEDPNSGDFESGNGFGAPPDDGFQQPVPGGANGSPFYEGTSAPRRLDTGQASSAPKRNDYLAGVDDFELNAGPSIPSNLAGPDRAVRPAGFQETPTTADFGFDPSATPDPANAQAAASDSGFGHDAANYAWLRGVVDYDPQRKNWHIIYGLPPDPNDRFGGSLTLADGGHLSEFRDSDVVLVQGRIDPVAGQDMLGKPLYRVSKAELIGRFE